MLVPKDRIARSMFSNGFLPGNRAAKRALPGTKSTKTKLIAERNKELLSGGTKTQTVVVAAMERSSTKSKSGTTEERNPNALFFTEWVSLFCVCIFFETAISVKSFDITLPADYKISYVARVRK